MRPDGFLKPVGSFIYNKKQKIMLEDMVKTLCEELGIDPDTVEKAKVANALLKANRNLLNLVWRMRQFQRKYYAGQKMLLPLSKEYEKKVDSALSVLIDAKNEPSLF